MLCFTNYVHFGVKVKAEKQSRSYLSLQLGRICSRVRDRHSERNTIAVCGGFLTYNLNCQPVLALIMRQNAVEHSASAKKACQSPELPLAVCVFRERKVHELQPQTGDKELKPDKGCNNC